MSDDTGLLAETATNLSIRIQDPEVQSIAKEVRWTIVDRLQSRRLQGVQKTGDRRVIYGWLGFLEFVALDWAEKRDVEQEKIIDLALVYLGRILS